MSGERSYISFTVDTDTTDADQNTDALLQGQKWDTTSSKVITYSFIDSAMDLSYRLNGGAAFHSQFSAAQMTGAKLAQSMFASVADVTFEEIGDDLGEDNANGTLRYMNVTGIGTAYGYYPFFDETGGDMAFAIGEYDTPTLGSYDLTAGLLHEMGHSMGLKHGFDTSVGGASTADKDSHEYSVMTYHSYVGQPDSISFLTNEPGHNPQSLMMFDIAALQRMYGANFTEESGNTVYTFSTSTGEMSINGVGQGTPDENVILRTLWDGGGKDTYDLSNYSTDLMIDLTPGEYSDFDVTGGAQHALLNSGWKDDGSFGGSDFEVLAKGHLYNALQYEGSAASLIENATGGAGDDEIIGNVANNILKGGKGADILSGGDGKDRLLGNGGGDEMSGGAGKDKLFGGAGHDILVGDAGRDTLKGGKGNDALAGGAGNDKLIGGGGRDRFDFIVSENSGKDKIIGFNDGKDSIHIAGGDMGMLSITASGTDTVIAWDVNTITLKGIDVSLIGVDDFDFI